VSHQSNAFLLEGLEEVCFFIVIVFHKRQVLYVNTQGGDVALLVLNISLIPAS